jgi:hypothetical protein
MVAAAAAATTTIDFAQSISFFLNYHYFSGGHIVLYLSA